MATKFFSKRNLQFLLYEVLDVESLSQYEYYKDHNKKIFDMVLQAVSYTHLTLPTTPYV